PPGRAPQRYAQAHLERGVATLRELGVHSRFSVREADAPIDGILEEMRAEPTDLVVIGAGSRVTRQVLRTCGCSILVVPEGSW
ncbi:MAG TPA: universal stress protein, partial [Myxococcota bacterium]|nr:universal stress protein [Myxococcota bacterium]